jgi:hypothetical protein
MQDRRRNSDFIGENEKHKILNKLVEWIKAHSDQDPNF